MQLIQKFNVHLVCIVIGLLLVIQAMTASAEPASFTQWLQGVENEAIARGTPKASVKSAIKTIRFMPKVIELDRAQPEFIHTFLTYYNNHVSPSRIKDGQKKLRYYRTLLHRLEQQYGIPKAYLVAFWGLETNYGHFQGNLHTLSALATLAYEGRRADFFRGQLLDALQVINQHNINARYLKGSWAGAFGHMQFMPSTFLKFAVDGDGNKKIDLKRSIPDALHSAGNYLSQVGWQKQQPTVIEVKLPANFPYQQAHLNNRLTVESWMALGVKAVQVKASNAVFAGVHQYLEKKLRKTKQDTLPGLNPRTVKILPMSQVVNNTHLNAAILLPQGWRGPAFMVFDNFHTVLDWNRSVNYALSIGLLANHLDRNAILGHGGLSEKGALTYVQTYHLQKILNTFGFDAGKPDGYPGLQTQAAIRAYQLSQALPADGYASPNLYHHLDANKSLSGH